MLTKVSGHPNLRKNNKGAIVNIDSFALVKAKKKKQASSNLLSMINTLERRIVALEKIINDK